MSLHHSSKIVTDNLVLALDPGNVKSYSSNVHPYPLDIGTWKSNGNNFTGSRDETVTDSPVGGIPLKMIVTGGDPYTTSYNLSSWNLATVAQGKTWTVSVYAKSSIPTVGQIFIFGSTAAGNYLEAPAGGLSITQNWQRFSFTRTFVNASTTNIQTRLDGPDSGFGTDGVTRPTIWWDGLQVEQGSTPTTFSSIKNINGINLVDLTGNTTATLYDAPIYTTTSTNSYFSFNGTSHYAQVPSSANWAVGTNATIDIWVRPITSYTTNHRLWCVNNNSTNLDAYIDPAGRFYMHGGLVGTTSTVPLNSWINISVVYTNGTVSIYFNGVAQPLSGTTTGYNISGTGTLFLGQFSGGGSYYWKGDFSAFKIYRSALTAADIQQNFNALRGRYGL